MQRIELGRRAFITGLASLIAAPSIVRAEFKQENGWTLYQNEYLIERTFDFRNGGGRTTFQNCDIRCCLFLADETTEFVTLKDCYFRHSDLSQLFKMRPEFAKMRGNMLPFDEGSKCGVPVS